MLQKVERYFEYQDGILQMWSRINSEFGPVTLLTSFPIECPPAKHLEEVFSLEFRSLSQYCSSSSPDFFLFRLSELDFFLKVAVMFNPQNKFDYGLPTPPQDAETD